MKIRPLREENKRDPKTEWSSGWSPKGNLWENYTHDSYTGNTEATHASARNQGAPGERRESDEQRVGERFGKVMRVELVGCRQEGEQSLETEEAGQKKLGQ